MPAHIIVGYLIIPAWNLGHKMVLVYVEDGKILREHQFVKVSGEAKYFWAQGI